MLRTFIDATNEGDSRWGGRWGPPLVDEDWHAVCQAITKDVEGTEWEKLYHKLVELKKAVDVRHPSGNGRTKTLWKSRRLKRMETNSTIKPATRRSSTGMRFGRNCGTSIC